MPEVAGASGVVVRCPCGRTFDAEAFALLTFVAFAPTGTETHFHEVRLCECGASIEGTSVGAAKDQIA